MLFNAYDCQFRCSGVPVHLNLRANSFEQTRPFVWTDAPVWMKRWAARGPGPAIYINKMITILSGVGVEVRFRLRTCRLCAHMGWISFGELLTLFGHLSALVPIYGFVCQRVPGSCSAGERITIVKEVARLGWKFREIWSKIEKVWRGTHARTQTYAPPTVEAAAGLVAAGLVPKAFPWTKSVGFSVHRNIAGSRIILVLDRDIYIILLY